MDAELDNKIKEIGAMLGINDIPDNIGSILDSVLSSSDNSDNIGNTNISSNSSEDNESDFDTAKLLELIMKYKKIKEDSKNDDTVKLLRSLEPFLNTKRKRKIKKAITFMTVAKLAKDGLN